MRGRSRGVLLALLTSLALLHCLACVAVASVRCKITYKYTDPKDCSSWLSYDAVPANCRTAFEKRFNTPADQLPSEPGANPVRAKKVSATMAEIRKHMFCPICGGRAVTAKSYRLKRLVDKTIWVRTSSCTREKASKRVVQFGPVNVNVGCPRCAPQPTTRPVAPSVLHTPGDVPYAYTYTGRRGTGLPGDISKLSGLLGKLARQAIRIDTKDPRAFVTRHAARCLLEKAAFDVDSYAVELARLSALTPATSAPGGAAVAPSSARTPVVSPAKPAKTTAQGAKPPVTFIGRVAEVRETRCGLMLLVRLYRRQRYAAVICTGWVPVRKGQVVFVSGILRDPAGPVPLVEAAVAVGVHRADPLFESKRPYRSPVSVITTDAEKKLAMARAYVSNNMKTEAIALCRKIIKEDPKSDVADEARKLLAKMGE